VLRPRVIVYTLILGLLVAALVAGLALRSPIRVDVVRDRASLARIVDDGYVENVYRLHLMNATEAPQRYRISVQGLPDIAVPGQVSAQAAPAEAVWVTVPARIPPQVAAAAGPGVHPIVFEVEQLPARADEPAVRASSKSTFIVPR
jgi:polyferredoxin